MNHKRKRPKNRRAGCLMCKPQKMNHPRRSGSIKVQVERQLLRAGDE